ncbi:MAG: TerB family tellurite resistance protein [Hasllibacter sp.]
MDSALAERQLASLCVSDAVVANPMTFKSHLGIGADAYTSMWLGRRLQKAWDVAGIAASGASVASSSAVASTFFGGGGWLAAIGIGGAAVTPVGWVAAAAVTSAGAYYGVTRLVGEFSSDRVDEIPKYINTPLDILGASLFDLIAPLALKVASADGAVTGPEREAIVAYFTEEWGLSRGFAANGLAIVEANVDDGRIDAMAAALREFKRANKDCNPAHIHRRLMKELREVALADGTLDEREEMAIERIDRLLRGADETALDRVARITSGAASLSTSAIARLRTAFRRSPGSKKDA